MTDTIDLEIGVTLVVFRVWKRDRTNNAGADNETVFAMFPGDPEGAYGEYVSCYEHLGGHGSADYAGCIRRSRPARPEEYARLKRELEGAPYNYRLRVIQRRGRV